MLLATFVIAGLCMSNFDRGLKENIPPYTWGVGRRSKAARVNTGAGAGEKSAQGLERTETRMSMD